MNELLRLQESIFTQASALPAEERRAYVARACAGDDALLRSITELLEAGAVVGDRFESPPTSLGPEFARARGPDPSIGRRIGRYVLREKIGEGGTGLVYAAEQIEPVRRMVAFKLMKEGSRPAAARARFAAEQQALASVEHPNIAHLFDAGTSDDGRRYFVMELVHGPRLTDYCDSRHLSVRERLGLFVTVCRAVHYAHIKNVIHRDLKPANILVAVHDGVPVPKVIDFGLAQTTAPDGTHGTDTAPFEGLCGTPEYLSPEQAAAGPRLADPRSDIYSLGVVLYELVTGETPLQWRSATMIHVDELRRRIAFEEPRPPSRCFAALSPALARQRAALRATTPEALVRQLQETLDETTRHCLEKCPAERYPSAAALADDVVRLAYARLDTPRRRTVLESLAPWLLPPRRRLTRTRTPNPSVPVPTANQAAFAAFLRGRRLADLSYNREAVTATVAAFEEATRLDPAFALAWAHLSMAHGAMYWFTFLDPSTQRLARCKEAVDQALRLQPELPEAHLTLGVYYYRGFRDWENAQRELTIAQHSLPDDSTVLCYLGLNERRMGRWPESTAHFERAVAVDPRNTTAWLGLIDSHSFHRRHRAALDACTRALSFAPEDRLARRARCWNQFALDGDRAGLSRGLAACLAAPPDDARDRAELGLWSGDLDAAARALAQSPALSFRDNRREIAKAELQALVARLRGDEPAAHRFAAIAAGFYGASMLHREPEEVFNLMSLGWALVLLGRSDEGLDYGRRALARLPVTRDALWGAELMVEHATLCALAGAWDEALTRLAKALEGPCDVSAHELRHHPLWQPLAGESRFTAMLDGLAALPEAA